MEGLYTSEEDYLSRVEQLEKVVKHRSERKDEDGNPIPPAKEEVGLITTFLSFLNPLPKMVGAIFWALKRLIPMNPMECVVVDSIENPTKTLLAKRPPDDPHYPGEQLHSPGAILGFGERYGAAVVRCIAKETGCEVKRAVFVRANNIPNLARGHELSLIFLVELDGEPNERQMTKRRLEWHPWNQLPENRISHHVRIHDLVKTWWNFVFLSLPEYLRTQFLEATTPGESPES